MGNVEKALLVHFAMHNPDGIAQYEEKLWSDASSDDYDRRLIERGIRMLEDIRSGAVLDDGPQSERGSRAEHGENRWEPPPVDDRGP